jgi:hypothetical protein
MTWGGHFILPFLTTLSLEWINIFFPFQLLSLFESIENSYPFNFVFFLNQWKFDPLQAPNPQKSL